jgi:hypothetical protein
MRASWQGICGSGQFGYIAEPLEGRMADDRPAAFRILAGFFMD